MATIKFSGSIGVTQATSIAVPLGGTPVVGDLVVVFLATTNEIITHQPGWNTEFTATPNPWFMGDSIRSPNTATLSSWFHTWNASDSGTSVTFTFVPAPTLGIGDKDIPNTNAVAVAVVLDGTNLTAVLEHNTQGNDGVLENSQVSAPLKNPANLALHAAFSPGSTITMTDSDPNATLVKHVANANPPIMLTLNVFSVPNPPAGYVATFSKGASAQLITVAAVSVSDNQPQLYNPPFIEEAPMGDNRLFYRYRMNRFFTVLNNSGVFSAKRYLSTDDVAAATQVFTNNQPITSTDRTNILNSGVGGEFQAVT